MRGDLTVKGLHGSMPVRIPASSTRYEAGEPLYSDTTFTSGADVAGSAVSVNSFEIAQADCPVISTNKLGGVAINSCKPFGTGTVVAHRTNVARPVAWIGQIHGRAETVASVDTTTELLLLIGDATLIDYNATGGTDSGELYTIKETASADTSGLVIVDGNVTKSELHVIVDGRSYRHDVA